MSEMFTPDSSIIYHSSSIRRRDVFPIFLRSFHRELFNCTSVCFPALLIPGVAPPRYTSLPRSEPLIAIVLIAKKEREKEKKKARTIC